MLKEYERTNFIKTYAKQKDFSDLSAIYLDYLGASYVDAIKKITTYSTLTITQELEHRLDLISLKAYGISDLWWVIAMYNGIINNFYDVVQGKKLKIPDRNILDIVLQSNVEPTVTSNAVELQ